MKNFKSIIIGVAFVALGGVAQAGRGGSLGKIEAAIASGSVDAIIAEVERAEHLSCPRCFSTMSGLLSHSRYEVRQVAGWWFAKRPSSKSVYITQMTTELDSSDSTDVRNAADFLGTVKAYQALPALQTTLARNGLSAEARLHIVRAAGRMAARSGNTILAAGMADEDPNVRFEAVKWWSDVLRQNEVAPVRGVLGDSVAMIRAEAATTLGQLRDAGARGTLEQMVVSDPDAAVRRNAAWALGRIGDAASRSALETAANEASPLVRLTAQAAIQLLR
jgi:HEAT repeat protein